VDVPKANSIVASAAQMAPSRSTAMVASRQSWQDRAWGYFDSVGELQYAANWFGAALSRARLYVAQRQGRDFDTAENGPAVETLAAFFDGPEGQAQAMSQMGVHLFVVGECYVVGRKPRPNRNEKFVYQWEVVGIQEMRHLGTKWTIEYDDGLPNVTLADDEDVIRVWTPHPKKRYLANSPVRSCFAPLSEIEGGNAHIASQLISRLVGSGILLLPQGLTFPSPDGAGLPDTASESDKVMQVLYDAMNAAISNPGTAASQTPIVMMVPDQFVDKANLLKFWSELDEKVIEIRNDALRRLGLGLNIPVEVLTGTADVNHWGAWQIDESSIKSHIEPVLEIIVNAFTTQLIYPVTKDRDDVVRYDTSALRLRPNRSKEAIELFDRGELKSETLLRETGFSAEDAPDDEERKRWLLMKIASGSATPEQVQAALAALGVMLAVAPLDNTTPRESRPSPSLQDHPARELPQEPAAALDVGLAASCDAMVWRALERAGNRIRSRKNFRPDGIEAADIYLHTSTRPGDLDALLEDAWSCAPRLLKGLPYEQREAVQGALDQYARHLLSGQVEHDTALMQRYLTHSAVRNPVI
jgi:hypothetical protein